MFTLFVVGLVYFILSILIREMAFSELLITSVALVVGFKTLRMARIETSHTLRQILWILTVILWVLVVVHLVLNVPQLSSLRFLVPGWWPRIVFTMDDLLRPLQRPFFQVNILVELWHVLLATAVGVYLLLRLSNHFATRRYEREMEAEAEAEAIPDPVPAPAAPAPRPARPPVSPSPAGTPPPPPPAASSSGAGSPT